jgi:monofunctional biosynthetic peptidoglycan transglycosylase
MGKSLKLTGKAVLLGGGLFVLWLFAVWPPPVWYRTHWPEETAFQAMRRSGSTVVGQPGGRLYRPVPLDSISKWVPIAVMTGEDQRFRDHGGIDWVNLRRAMGYPRDRFTWGVTRDRRDLVRALGRAYERRDALRGASTLTQQLAKNLYLSPSRNPLRKVKEAVTAYRLESALGKDRILELYLNVAEMGEGVWGVEAASERYFDRPAADLTLDQAAAIAGMLPFPLRSNPGHHPGRMQSRQRLILRVIRGEEVEVPPVPEEEAMPIPVESLPPAPVDTAPPLPVDSLGPVLPESLPPVMPDSTPSSSP